MGDETNAEHAEPLYLIEGDEVPEGFEAAGQDADLGEGNTESLFRWTGEGEPPTGSKWAGDTLDVA